ncbi:hypothetical protein CFP56_017139 [Quercus suber]|uniref:DUF4005 domain-containing protein n=1 Tax=Quercus suber TaxID=58331 RepID=A0AAW0M3U3_QUESU
MAKKTSWFNIMKSFLILYQKNKLKANQVLVFDSVLTARTIIRIFWLASLTAPLSLNERSLGEAGEEQIKFALAVAHALIAAADASITTTQVEVVWFTSMPQSSHQCENEVEEFSPLSPTINVRQKSINLLPLEFSLPFRDTIKTPSYKPITTLKCLQSIVVAGLHKKIWNSGRIAELERQDNKKSADTDQNIINGRWRHWLVQWVDTQITKSRELEYLDLALTSTLRQRYDYRRKQLNLKNVKGQRLDSPTFVPRISIHHRRQCSLRDHNPLLSSPVVPTYMNVTESTEAKARSMNSPKIRPRNFDT